MDENKVDLIDIGEDMADYIHELNQKEAATALRERRLQVMAGPKKARSRSERIARWCQSAIAKRLGLDKRIR